MRRTAVSLSRLLWNIFICVTAAFYPFIQRTAFAASAAITGSVIALSTVGSATLMSRAPNPHMALLFIDFLLSKEGQQLIMKGGLWSPREDVGTVEQKFKKSYLDEKYSLEELEVKFSQWENLLRQLFIRKQ